MNKVVIVKKKIKKAIKTKKMLKTIGSLAVRNAFGDISEIYHRSEIDHPSHC